MWNQIKAPTTLQYSFQKAIFEQINLMWGHWRCWTGQTQPPLEGYCRSLPPDYPVYNLRAADALFLGDQVWFIDGPSGDRTFLIFQPSKWCDPKYRHHRCHVYKSCLIDKTKPLSDRDWGKVDVQAVRADDFMASNIRFALSHQDSTQRSIAIPWALCCKSLMSIKLLIQAPRRTDQPLI